jgi:hypothetical protein
MPKQTSFPLLFEVGDLVCLAYDDFRMYGYGLVVNAFADNEYEVYWFKEKVVDIETAYDILPAELPDDWE